MGSACRRWDWLRATVLACGFGSLSVGCVAGQEGIAAGVAVAPAGEVVAPPGVLADVRLTPPEDPDALATLEEVLASLDDSAYAFEASETELAGVTTRESMLDYARGRYAWRSSQNVDAVRYLERSRAIDGGAAYIHRILGLLYAESGSSARAMFHLQRALADNPDDAAALYVYARLRASLPEHDPTETVALLGRAQALLADKTASPVGVLIRHQLAIELEAMGRPAAAYEQMETFMRSARRFSRRDDFVGLLAQLDQRRAVSWVRLGDLALQLDRPLTAVAAYEKAAQAGTGLLGLSGRPELTARVVYALVRLEQTELASTLVLETLQEDGERAQALVGLPAWLMTTGQVDGRRLRNRVEALYESDPRSATVLAWAGLLSADEGLAVLAAYLDEQPGDAAVYQTWLEVTDQVWAHPSRAQAVVAHTARWIVGDASRARQYVTRMLGVFADPAELAEAVQPDEGEALELVLRASAWDAAGALDRALVDVRQAAAWAPEDVYVQSVLLAVLAKSGQLAEAESAADALADESDVELRYLRARVYAASTRMADALAVLDGVVTDRPDALEPMLLKAQVEASLDDLQAAEATLLDALNRFSRDARVYEALFGLYDAQDENQRPRIAEANAKKNRLFLRALRDVPGARVTRLERARRAVRSGQVVQAEGFLNGLLADQPGDLDALGMMIELLWRTDRQAEALDWTERGLVLYPQSAALLGLAGRMYAETGDEARWFEVNQQRLLLMPAGAERATALAGFYVSADREALAWEVIDQALSDGEPIAEPGGLMRVAFGLMESETDAEASLARLAAWGERYPEAADSIAFTRARLLDLSGRWDEAEAELEALVERAPEGVIWLNYLGYGWTLRHTRLDEAVVLLERAVMLTGGTDGNLLDSLGWCYYKLGRIEEAVAQLRRADAAMTHPLLKEHLGDALYRRGRATLAARAWADALALLATLPPQADVEMEGMGPRLRQKIQAVEAGEEPGVSPLASEGEPGLDFAVDRLSGAAAAPAE